MNAEAQRIRFKVRNYQQLGVGSLSCSKDSGCNAGPSAIPRKFLESTGYWTVTAGIAKSTITPTHMTTSPARSHRPEQAITHSLKGCH